MGRGGEKKKQNTQPQRYTANRVGQVYSEVEIQMCGGRRKRLADQLFPLVVTVVNFPLPTPGNSREKVAKTIKDPKHLQDDKSTCISGN